MQSFELKCQALCAFSFKTNIKMSFVKCNGAHTAGRVYFFFPLLFFITFFPIPSMQRLRCSILWGVRRNVMKDAQRSVLVQSEVVVRWSKVFTISRNVGSHTHKKIKTRKSPGVVHPLQHPVCLLVYLVGRGTPSLCCQIHIHIKCSSSPWLVSAGWYAFDGASEDTRQSMPPNGCAGTQVKGTNSASSICLLVTHHKCRL